MLNCDAKDKRCPITGKRCTAEECMAWIKAPIKEDETEKYKIIFTHEGYCDFISFIASVPEALQDIASRTN